MPFDHTPINILAARKITDLFNAASIGEIVSFDQISRAIGFDCRTRRWLIPKALRLANGESGAIFVNRRMEGYLRLAGKDSHALGRRARKRVGRISRVTQRFVTRALLTSNDMPDEDRRQIVSELAALGLLQHLAQDRNLPKIAGTEPLPTAQVLAATLATMKGVSDGRAD